jgi:hypothetical protein
MSFNHTSSIGANSHTPEGSVIPESVIESADPDEIVERLNVLDPRYISDNIK